MEKGGSLRVVGVASTYPSSFLDEGTCRIDTLLHFWRRAGVNKMDLLPPLLNFWRRALVASTYPISR